MVISTVRKIHQGREMGVFGWGWCTFKQPEKPSVGR